MANRSMKRQLHIGYILEAPGRSYADWRHPRAVPNAALQFGWFKKQAQMAERAKLDFIFIADNTYISGKEHARHLNRFEPITLFSAISAVTEHIGLGVTMSTSFTPPYSLARYFASMDHLSGGRAAWNLVTSSNLDAGVNFGTKTPEHDLRYEIAEEHLNVVQGLWDSWEEDALLYDVENGRYHDPAKVHPVNHVGKHYQVKGALNIARTPQGQPVIFQAGDSPVGRRFAAKRADAIFAMSYEMEKSRAIYSEIKGIAAGFGRNPEHLLILPASISFVGSTEAEAQVKAQERADLLSDEECYVQVRKYFSGVDLRSMDPNAPFPLDLFEKADLEGSQSHILRIREIVKAEKPTLRQLARRIGAPPAEFTGTPEQVADRMQRRFENRACDGFVFGQALPDEMEVLCTEVLPILRRRGLFREEYEGTTLRESLGIDQPPNRYTAARTAKQRA